MDNRDNNRDILIDLVRVERRKVVALERIELILETIYNVPDLKKKGLSDDYSRS